ncbi:MAG: DDE-type integrase/transposase/recombinase [Oligoflexia bacterium]|nr:DDE-type integrase/transposase/recombinase [Oligoflexia bacterium]
MTLLTKELSKRSFMSESDKNLELATFRFGIISEFVTGLRLDRGEREKLIREKVARHYSIPNSAQTTIAKSTIKKWVTDYKNAGSRLDGLKPKPRKDLGLFKSLDASLQLEIKTIMRDRPELTGIALLTEMQHRKILASNEKINLSVLYRFLKKEKLHRQKTVVDRRSFEASAPNELWQSDVMHGPDVFVDGKTRKAYLIAILDDHSRLIVHAEFFLSESLNDFKSCLKTAIEKRGLPHKLYIDNGSCYRALNLEQITALLGVGIVHTPPYTPQGRGKIERWFRFVRESFLVTCGKEMTLKTLNESLDNWIENYHNRVHSTTNLTPLSRYQSNMKCFRPAPKDLINYFRMIEFRRVKKDRTMRLNGTIFELPIPLIDLQVELRFHRELPDEVEVFYEGRSFGNAVLLDRHVNFKLGRNHKIVLSEKEIKVPTGELFDGGMR